MTNGMARVLAAALLAGACASGCLPGFEAPIDAVPSVAVDPALVGRWRCVTADPENDEPATLSFTAKTAQEYAISFAITGEKTSQVTAYASTVNGVPLLNVPWSEGKSDTTWTVLRYAFLRPNVLQVQDVDSNEFEAALKTASLRAVLEQHLADEGATLDLFMCVRLDADEPATAGHVLEAGDAAPALEVEAWLQGQPVESFEPGKVYVLDFLAPWCAPCLALAPHVSELAERLAPQGVRFIGVMGPDTSGTTRESAAQLVARKKDVLRIPVAFDRLAEGREPVYEILQGKTMGAYLNGTGVGVPGSVIIDGEGRVAWFGLPSDLAPVLESILAGRWDRRAFAARWAAAVAAEPKADEMAKLIKEGDGAGAMRIARELIAGPFDDSSGHLRMLVDKMLGAASGGAQEIDLDLALAAALRAEMLSEGTDATVLATLAKVWAARGDFVRAVAVQERAVPRAGDMRPFMEKRLAEYKSERAKRASSVP